MPAQFPKSTVDRVGYWGCRNPASASLSWSHLRLLGSATQLWAYEEWCWPQHLTVCSLSEFQAQKLSKLLSCWEHQNLILKNIYLILCVHVSDCVYVMGAHKLWPSGSHSSLTMCIRETGLCQSSLEASDFTCWTVYGLQNRILLCFSFWNAAVAVIHFSFLPWGLNSYSWTSPHA